MSDGDTRTRGEGRGNPVFDAPLDGEPVPQIPILRIGNCLIATIYVAIDDEAVRSFQGRLLKRISEEGSEGVVLDLTAVTLIDSYMARALEEITAASKLLGATVVLVGMQPSVAFTLVEMGLTIPSALSRLDLERGLLAIQQQCSSPSKVLESLIGERGKRG